MLTCNFIGTGKLGIQLAHNLSIRNIVKIQSIYNKNYTSSQNSAPHFQHALAISDINQMPVADLYFITTTDDQIESIAQTLAKENLVPSKAKVIHCSGSLNSSCLSSLLTPNIASCHPLKAFSNKVLNDNAFNRVHCIIEGESSTCEWLNDILLKLNALPTRIDGKDKITYHSAAVFAANYMTALYDIASQLMQSTGIKKKQAQQMILHLMKGNLDNLENADNTSDALTGPVARGDVEVIKKHLKSIENPLFKDIYQMLGKQTVSLAKHSVEVKKKLFEILG